MLFVRVSHEIAPNLRVTDLCENTTKNIPEYPHCNISGYFWKIMQKKFFFTYIDIANREDSLSIGNSSFKPIVVDPSRQADQLALVQRQFNRWLCMKIEFGPSLSFAEFFRWQFRSIFG